MITFPERFRTLAQIQPDKVALVCGDERITYRELDDLSDRFAGAVAARGAGREKIYPIMLPRGIDYLAAAIGVQKAGAAFAPLSLEYPADRVTYIVGDCGSDLLIDQGFVDAARDHEPLRDCPVIDPRDAAMVTYTSGSTGNPKGILHEHDGFTRAIVAELPISCEAGGIELSVTPFNFAISMADIFVPLWVGATICILSEEERRDIAVVDRSIDEYAITATVMSPQLLKRLPDRPSTLRTVCCGGERLSGVFREHGTIYNGYGLSELLSVAIAFEVHKAYENTPIGYPTKGYSVYLLDEDGNQVPDGSEGEICIAGPIARGYIGLPEKTAAAFRENPFASGLGDERLFMTGDVGYRDEEGRIVYVNRMDWMVKVNGQRVETGEPEVAMTAVDGIENAVVKAFEDNDGQTYLCGYYVPEKQAGRSDAEFDALIRSELSSKMPDYMIPRFLVRLEAFPLNVNGKVDRKSLQAPDAASFSRAYVAPETAKQKRICEAFASVLGIENVGIDDDFFALGGDSIKVIMLQAELAQDALAAQDVFKGRTPRAIAAQLGKGEQEAGLYADLDSLRVEREAYPMTDSQLGVYLECARDPERLMYNNAMGFLFEPDWDIDRRRLRDAVVAVIGEYPFMRVHAAQKNGIASLVYDADCAIDVPITEKPAATTDELIASFAQPFDLECGPLFRFEVCACRDGVVLLGDMHHIIADGTSTALFYDRVAQVFGGKDLGAQTVDSFMVANAHEAARKSGRTQRDQEFFDAMLDGVEVDSSPIADDRAILEEDRPVSRGVDVSVRDEKTLASIAACTRATGITESSLFLGAYLYALAKSSGQSEVLACMAENGRHDPALGATFGMLVKTLPLYTTIDETERTAAFLERIQDLQFSCMEHDQCSFVELAARHNVRSDVMFVYQGDMLSGIDLDGRFVAMRRAPHEDAMATIALSVSKGSEGYELSFEYRADRYTRDTIERFGALMVRIVEGLLEDQNLSEIELCSREELDRLRALDRTGVPDYDHNLTVVDLFRAQVQAHPDNEAIVSGDRVLTYGELDRRSEALACELAKRGVRREVPVGVLVKRNEQFPICILGILKAGGAVQPLDAKYPEERLRYMLEDSGAPIVIVDETLKPLVPERFEGAVLNASEAVDLALDASVELEGPAADTLFTLLYTSGTTGKPKGVMLEHRNLVNFCMCLHERLDLGPTDRASAHGSFGFDASMLEFYTYLTSGGCVCIIPDDIRLDLPALHEFMLSNRITVAFFTTQLGRQYVCAYPDDPLKALLSGGEKHVPCEPPRYDYINAYGPTECTIFVTDFSIDREYDVVPIGFSTGDNELYIVDAFNRPLPVGVPGELAVSGRQVARGYLNLPDKTQAAFTENPFSDEDGFTRMYMTGDVCRRLADGAMQYVGRADEQVKIRGFRIELSEIEKRIRDFEPVRNASVIAYDLPAGGKAIAAYVVADDPVDVGALNAFIKEELPAYMVPAVTMQIEEIPLNHNGKVDKRKLPEPKAATSTASASHPLTKLEQELVGIVADATGNDAIGIGDDLMACGVTSLSAIMVATELEERYGCRISVATLLEGGSILSIEDAIVEHLLSSVCADGAPPSDGSGSAASPAAVTDETGVNRERAPLSSAQLGVYYDAMKRPEALTYNIPTLATLPLSVDEGRLAAALVAAVDAHPVLKAHVESAGSVQELVFDNDRVLDVPVVQEGEASLKARAPQLARPFDLHEGPLCRCEIVRTEHRVALFFDAHHLVFDGFSLSVFLRDVRAAYEGSPLETEVVQLDAARIELETADGSAGEASRAYFRDLFSEFGGEATRIAPKLGGRVEDGALARVEVPFRGGDLDRFTRERRTTPARLFLAATGYVIARYAAERSVYFSMVSAGRDDARMRAGVGMFVKTLPLHIGVDPDVSVAEYLEAMGSAMGEALAHASYPFLEIVGEAGYSPSIDFACQLGLESELAFEGVPIETEFVGDLRPKFDLSIHIEGTTASPVIALEYNDALFDEAFADGFARAVASAARHMMADPDARCASVSLLDERERERVAAFGAGERFEAALDGGETFHGLFERCAERYPERVALVAADATLTYAELDALTNRMANGLIQAGLQRNDRVVLLLPRTSRSIAAMYAVMKAGGAYIPCDPAYPQERIAHILADSEARFAIVPPDRLDELPSVQALDVERLASCSIERSPEIPRSATDVAYLIYTSGSTGTPKGVVLSHRGIANYLCDRAGNRHVHALAAEAHALVSVTTASFDMSLKETAVSLSSGLTLVLADEDEARDPVLLARLFERTGADAFNATPSRMASYLGLPAFRDAMASCSVVMCGGEKMPDALLAELQGVTAARIFNTYGPTEITVSCNAKELTGETHVTIGAPLLNVTEFIVDADGNEVPVGVTGELLVGGPGVALGYWNREDQTREAFVEHCGMRVFRTGDFAAWTDEGDVSVFGRMDDQVKLRGLRIELEEVERRLLEHERVASAVVAIRTIGQAEHLSAYYVADVPIDAAEIRDMLAKTLAGYMVPTAYLQMQAFPITPNGKTDVRALPDPELLGATAYAEPETELERTMAELFASVLGIDRVGACDSFFDLGGTSLSATQVLIACDEANLAVSYGDIFAHPTPRGLAELADGRAGKRPSSEASSDRDSDASGTRVGGDGFDYGSIDALLDGNTLDAYRGGEPQELGDILLTGATGFLGIHVLRAFLEQEAGRVVCLIRKGSTSSPENRLKAKLFYYFENSYEELFGTRIFVVEGDVADDAWHEDVREHAIDTVINCAASVKHFASGSTIGNVNIGGVEHLIGFCLASGARLVQVSTTSVAGERVGEEPPAGAKLTERDLFIGQRVDNQYTHSKFVAERMVLAAIDRGLDAKIMRVGNLGPRTSDGEFQINFSTNGFMGRLRAYLLIGGFPYSMLDATTEIAPIDNTAKAVLLLSRTPQPCRVFHPFNNHSIAIGDIISQMRLMGLGIEFMEDDEYERAFRTAMADPKKAAALTSLLAYQSKDAGEAVEFVKVKNQFTTQVLYRLGFEWSMTSKTYIAQFVKALMGLGFFDSDGSSGHV